MSNEFKDKVKGILIIPVGLSIILVPFSILIGWNLLTLFLFWFVLTPLLTYYLPKIVSKKKRHLFESIVGLILFYSIMVFMIYDHYKTDYFQVMIASCVINLGLITIISLTKETRVETK